MECSPWLLAVAVSTFGLGVFFHFVSDMQKHMSLRLAPGKLITYSLFSRSRNTNYFGELLIYSSFALLSLHWIHFVVLILFIGVVWVPNMKRKDRSLSRYPEFKDYKKKSLMFFPF